MPNQGSEYLDVQQGLAGAPAGPKLTASLFVPFGSGVVFLDDNAGFWQLRLAQNPDGTIFLGLDGKPTIELIEVGL